MNVSWWCSGSNGEPWTWTYAPLAGPWIIAAILVALRVVAQRYVAPQNAARDRRQTVAFYSAVGLFVVMSEWPLGPLGAGYLLSIGTLRYLVFTLMVGPLILLGTPSWLWNRIINVHPTLAWLWRGCTRWPSAVAIVTAVLIVTHMPPVVDTLKTYQIGSFVLDMAWIFAAVVMWWPVFGPAEVTPRLGDPAREVYLFTQSLAPIGPASFLTFAELPLYGLYELAPPIFLSYDPQVDQQIAGLSMKIGGGLYLWIVIAVLFMRWATRQERLRRGEATDADLAAEVDAMRVDGHASANKPYN